MQLIFDSETTIDIKRNMSCETLNDSPLTEKLDVTHDLKSGLCNGNKENIQNNDKTILSDEKTLEKDKVEDDIVSESPIPADSKENMEVDDNVGENNTSQEENKSEESTQEIENPSVIEDATNVVDKSDPSKDKIKSSNGIDELNKYENLEETGSSNGKECQRTNEQKEDHKKVEHLAEGDGKFEVSEKVENSEKVVVTENEKHLEELTEVDGNFGVSEKVENAENVVAVENKKAEHLEELTEVDEKVEVSEKVENAEKVVATENEKVEHLDELTEVDEKVEVSEKVENAEKVVAAEKVHENVQGEINIDEKAETEICETKQEDKIVEGVNGKAHNDLKIKNADEKCENVVEQVNIDSVELTNDKNVTLDVKEVTFDVNNEVDTVKKSDVEAPVASVTQNSAQNSSCDSQMPNEQIVAQKSDEDVTKDNNTLNNQLNTDEIETVNLDDEEKETESSKPCSGIVNICGEISKTNNDSDLVANKTERSVTEMETVDLDDEKDVSETEPMDVDINGETGEHEMNEISESSKKEEVFNLDCEDNRDECLSIKEKTDNIVLKNCVTAMDEDFHPIESKSKDKSFVETTEKEKEKATSMQSKITNELKPVPSIIKLSNTLDILSDDEDEVQESQKTEPQPQSKAVENDADKKCINIDDDDDIMLIDEEDTNIEDTQNKPSKLEPEISEIEPKVKSETAVEVNSHPKISEEAEKLTEKKEAVDETAEPVVDVKEEILVKEEEKITDVKPALPKPLIPNDFLKTCKKNMAEMTRDDLEEFCILKIVESVVDRSSLSEIKTKLKSMSQSIEEYKKKAMMLTKQNRDLQVVLKTIQEEQKNSKTVTPLKITRSVGMQVLMTDRSNIRRKPPAPASNVTANTTPTKSPRATNQRAVKVPAAPSPQPIPVPRLIPASNSPAAKNNMQQTTTNNTAKAASPVNGVRNNQPKAEKRALPRNHSVTVDLTDDEPPTKLNRNSTPTPIRVVPPHMVPQNLLNSTPRHPIGQNNNPRKVYIPISGPQNPGVKTGQAIMLKSVTTPNQGPRPRVTQPHMSRLPSNQIRMSRMPSRHPAPLPESTKIYPGTYLKALPPAPDLKLSKVENGIVISWKIEGYQEDSYEEIASYQLYAYQETNAPPSTSLWKKIGDVKALPLPMACTLTQFMAGFKYYFAVRAVDIRSRIGPFSLPGSILLLNKL